MSFEHGVSDSSHLCSPDHQDGPVIIQNLTEDRSGSCYSTLSVHSDFREVCTKKSKVRYAGGFPVLCTMVGYSQTECRKGRADKVSAQGVILGWDSATEVHVDMIMTEASAAQPTKGCKNTRGLEK